MAIQRVLLVDDDRDLLRIAQLSLKKVGKWTVLLAANGPQALQLAAQERPDVILLDVMMPEMDGLSTLSKLRSLPETSAIPVIFLTAKVRAHEVDHYVGLGAVGVIIKPFDPMTLPAQVEKLVSGRR